MVHAHLPNHARVGVLFAVVGYFSRFIDDLVDDSGPHLDDA